MGGISTGTGVFSGINSRSIIDQLIAVESRPRALIQSRIVQLQGQSAAFLDLNTRLGSLRSAAGAFRTQSFFDLKQATSTNEDVLTATATNAAAPGSYTFRVERLVSTQQQLSRGFSDRNATAVGISSMTIESAQARLSRELSLGQFNNGDGIRRGKIRVTDSTGAAAVIDLSKALNLSDVLTALNDNQTVNVSARMIDGRIEVRDDAGGRIRIEEAEGGTTAASLGILGDQVGGVISGQRVYALNRNTTLTSLRDGLGVAIRDNATNSANFTLRINDGGTVTNVEVNLGNVYTTSGTPPTTTRTAGPVGTVGQAIDRINAALTGAGVSQFQAQIDAANGRITINNSGTATIEVVAATGDRVAADLGLATTTPVASITGQRILAEGGSVLASSLNGGRGVAGDGTIALTLRDGSIVNATVGTTGSLSEIARALEAAAGTDPSGRNKLSVRLTNQGTGLQLVDNTTGTGSFAVSNGATADALRISTAGGAQTQADGSIRGANLQMQYVGLGTRLESLNGGRGVGTGTFRIVTGTGATQVIDIGTDARTLDDIVREINSFSSTTLTFRARINDNGDGLIIEDTGTGTQRMRVEDVSGTVARGLGIAGTATGTGAGATNNFINGSQERTITFNAADTLDAVVRKINDAGAGARASIIQDGQGANPFRLTLAATRSGAAGEFVVDTGAFDLGLQTLSRGQDALAFFGSGDLATAVAVTSSTNTIDGVVPGVSVQLKSVNTSPATITVGEDNSRVLTGVKAFIDAYNALQARIENATRFDQATNRGGPLLGDNTAIELRGALAAAVQQPSLNVSGRYQRLTDVGISIDRSGRLQLNEERLRTALATDPESVRALFTARDQASGGGTRDLGGGVTVNDPNAPPRFTRLGAMGRLEQLIERYTDTTRGVLKGRQDAITGQIEVQNGRITALNSRLESRRQVLEAQFAAMETAIGRLQRQQGALGPLFSAAARA